MRILILAAALIFAGCGDDDSSNANNSNTNGTNNASNNASNNATNNSNNGTNNETSNLMWSADVGADMVMGTAIAIEENTSARTVTLVLTTPSFDAFQFRLEDRLLADSIGTFSSRTDNLVFTYFGSLGNCQSTSQSVDASEMGLTITSVEGFYAAGSFTGTMKCDGVEELVTVDGTFSYE